jgi:hypothetical protein
VASRSAESEAVTNADAEQPRVEKKRAREKEHRQEIAKAGDIDFD